MSLPENAPSPRLCHLIKWPDFDGYGFNLHAEKTKAGQYIGKVDDDSPAMLAGLREGDKIIEVNSVNISNENHRQVVERIKSIPNETKLLVVEDGADKWYRERKIVIKNSQPNVVYFRTPVPRPAAGTCPMPSIAEPSTQQQQQQPQPPPPPQQAPAINLSQSTHSLSSSSIAEDEAHPQESSKAQVAETTSDKPNENGSSVRVSSSMSNGMNSNTTISSNNSSSGSKAESISNSPRSSHSSVHDLHRTEETSSLSKSIGEQSDDNGLNLNMSVSQMRQLIAQRKKKDAKKDNIDLLKKYEIIQQM